MMEISFKGKRILVTGAGQGIGRGIAVELWRAGANIVALSRTRSHLEALQSEYPSIDIVDVDIADWEKTRGIVESLGPFDALVNNAAIAICEPFLTCSSSNFDKTFDVNVKAVLNISQVVARKMIEKKINGAIVNISSQASKAALQDHTIYSASKAALDALTRAMALELGPQGIRVNAVNPTVIMTAMAKVGWSDEKKSSEMLSKIPLRRFGEVQEVVNAVVFLLSERASMITGVELPVDGGFLAT
ncbi:D-erythrulose reductase-like [Pieris brassicae]|nr:D-erythrulose reductase-like [Pieris brassicae]XP_045526258.1 D-erythrulose reductase-like [Pieris brassicae]